MLRRRRTATARPYGRVDDPWPIWRRSPAPADVRAAANSLHHRGCLLVYLSVPRPRPAFDAHYFPEQSVRVSRLSEPKTYPLAADPADRSVLCAEIPATVGDDAWRTPDADLAEVVRSDLLAMGLPDPSPRAVHVERRSHVYPVYLIGFERAQQQLDTWVDSVDGLVSSGVKRCSPTTTPTTPWRWVTPSPVPRSPRGRRPVSVAGGPGGLRRPRRRGLRAGYSRRARRHRAAGFLGRHVLEQAAAGGHEVFTVDRRHATHRSTDLVVDLAEPGDRQGELASVLRAAEAVIHLAGCGGVRRRRRRRPAPPAGQRVMAAHRAAPDSGAVPRGGHVVVVGVRRISTWSAER